MTFEATGTDNKITVTFEPSAGSITTRTITLATEGIKTMDGVTNSFRLVDDTGAVWGTITMQNTSAITDVDTFVNELADEMADGIMGNGVDAGGDMVTTLSTHAKNAEGLGLKMQVGDTAATYNQIEVSVEDMSTTGLNLKDISMGTQEAAAKALDSVKNAIEKVSTNRGKLGALQNRLSHTINNLGVTSENMTAAESRIRDVDMAKEMMSFTKNNVLAQAAQSMLAQANQQPQSVLQLLQ
jgi:flagellin